MAALDFFARVIIILLELLTYAMMIRMLYPLFGNPEESKLYNFVFCASEPFITPIRFILLKFNLFQDTPIDVPFFISYIVIIFLKALLPAV